MNDNATLLDLKHKTFRPYWVDPEQDLIIPDHPYHWKAHKLQMLLEMLTKQAEKNPAQFNSKNYIDALNDYTATIEIIKNGVPKKDVDTGEVDSERAKRDKAPAVGEGASLSVDSGISTDNPFAR